MFLAVVGEEAVGCVGVRIRRGGGEVNHLIVKPQFRNKGIASKLISLLIQYCERRRVPNLFLETIDAMEEALSLYAKMGFEEKERKALKKSAKPNQREVHLVKMELALS